MVSHNFFESCLFVSATPFEIIPDMRKSFEVKMKTTETTTWKKMIIGVDSRQDETCLPEIRPSQIAWPSEREGGDDWFVLFDVIREKPLVVPPGTFFIAEGLHCIHCAKIKFSLLVTNKMDCS